MGIPADDSAYEEVDDGRMLVAERLTPAEASLVVQELKDAGIESQILALPDERTSGPFDILVLDDDAHAAYTVIQQIEIVEDADNWFSERPAWQQAAFVVVGIIAVLIPLFFALVAILSNS